MPFLKPPRAGLIAVNGTATKPFGDKRGALLDPEDIREAATMSAKSLPGPVYFGETD